MASGRFNVLALVTHQGAILYQQAGEDGREVLNEPGITVAERRQSLEDGILAKEDVA